MKKPKRTSDELMLCEYFELEKYSDERDKLLYGCINELCYKCGCYETDYLGTCDGCKWKKVKDEKEE